MSNILYLFCSIDLSNSTKHKYHTRKWLEINLKVLEIVRKKLSQFKPWRNIGDEIVMAKKKLNQEDLIAALDEIKKQHSQITDYLQSESEKSTLFFNISVKTTLWCSIFKSKEDFLNEKNIEEINPLTENVCIEEKFLIQSDFLGAEVDAGFRIAKYSIPNGIIINATLAYLIHSLKKTEYFNLYHLGNESLKGVWDERKYPIISFGYNQKELSENIPFDNHSSNGYFSVMKNSKLRSMTEDTLLMNIKESIPAFRKMTNELDKILNNPSLLDSVDSSDTFLHFDAALVCFDKNGENVFITKRTISDVNPEEQKYMFGTAELRNDRSFEITLKAEYEKDFGFEDIEIFSYDNCNDNNSKSTCCKPKIVNTYSLEFNKNKSLKVHGLVFTAKLNDNIDLKKANNIAKDQGYVEKSCKWLSISEDGLLENYIDSDECVDDFKNSIRLARQVWGKIKIK